jgi:hypothetical protein
MITRMNQMQKSRRSESDMWTRVSTVLRVVKDQQWSSVQLSGVVSLMFTALDTILKGLVSPELQPKLQPIRIDDQQIRPRTNNKYHDSRK